MVHAPIAININFDSLNQAYGFPAGFRDPSFFEGMDRLLQIANRYQAPLSIFVIGRDLENPEIYARVKDWSDAGHEIGNHSWSHPVNLGRLSPDMIRDEITRAHEMIAKCTGKEPTGFIAPAWSTSKTLVNTLIDLNYLYDTSVFPSFLLYPAMITNALHFLGQPSEIKNILSRADWLGPILRPTRPFLAGKDFQVLESDEEEDESILILPLPTINRIMPCIWHSVGFMLGWKLIQKQLIKLLNDHKGFYYLLHPADFLGPEDQDKKHQHSLYRMSIPLQKKMEYLEKIFLQLAESGRPIVTMHDLACHHSKMPENKLKEKVNA
jgi:peptidoglycan-N-acetylglucosamine deacetylase